MRSDPHAGARRLAARLAEIFEGVRELIERHAPRRWRSRTCSTRETSARRSCSDMRAASSCSRPSRRRSRCTNTRPPRSRRRSSATGGDEGAGAVHADALLRLRSAPQPSDAADGVAAALTCLMRAHLHGLVLAAMRERHGPAVTPGMISQVTGTLVTKDLDRIEMITMAGCRTSSRCRSRRMRRCRTWVTDHRAHARRRARRRLAALRLPDGVRASRVPAAARRNWCGASAGAWECCRR